MEFNKKAYLDYLYYVKGNQWTNFKVSGLIKKDDGSIYSTKHKTYLDTIAKLNPWDSDKIYWINQRGILKNELVLDLEEKDTINIVIEKLLKAISTIDIISIQNCFLYDTGSRGYHFHIFVNQELSIKQKLSLIRYFKADTMKAYTDSLIALENVPHWKSGKIKGEIKEWWKINALMNK